MPNGKASAVAPKLSDDNHVELEEFIQEGQDSNPQDDLMQLARMGDVQGIEKLFESGKYDAQYCDGEGITPLHVIIFRSLNEQHTDPLPVGCDQ